MAVTVHLRASKKSKSRFNDSILLYVVGCIGFIGTIYLVFLTNSTSPDFTEEATGTGTLIHHKHQDTEIIPVKDMPPIILTDSILPDTTIEN